MPVDAFVNPGDVLERNDLEAVVHAQVGSDEMAAREMERFFETLRRQQTDTHAPTRSDGIGHRRGAKAEARDMRKDFGKPPPRTLRR